MDWRFGVVGADSELYPVFREHRRRFYIVVRELGLSSVTHKRSENHGRHILGKLLGYNPTVRAVNENVIEVELL